MTDSEVTLEEKKALCEVDRVSTSLPWEVNPENWQYGSVTIESRESEILAIVKLAIGRKVEGKANAEFIVRAVNSHDDLVEACTEANNFLASPFTAHQYQRNQMRLKLKHALAKAKGEN